MSDTLELKHSLTGYVFGNAVKGPDGWRFMPLVAGRKPSTKPHPTADACLPRWARRRLGGCSFLARS